MPSRNPENLSLEGKIKRLQGPILVLGASGFVGANLFRALSRHRDDVYGTASRLPAWRLDDLRSENIIVSDLLVDSNLDAMLDRVKPRTVFDCVGYGGYSFETDAGLIYETNFNLIGRLLSRLERRTIACYVHAGSSSEYGNNASGPRENSPTFPNSHYAVSKAATANLIHFFGKRKKLPCVNLRLYSAYGPLEDSSRLVPNLVRSGLAGEYPELVDPRVSRDFIYIDDVTDAFVTLACEIDDKDFGESFNVGTGTKTTIEDLGAIARDLFGLKQAPRYTMPNREWDLVDWYSDATKMSERFGWQARTRSARGWR